jgi:hypothetical protein
VSLTEDEFAELPRHLKQAALRGGAEGLLEAGFKPRPPAQQQPRQAEGQGREEGGDGDAAAGVRGPAWRRQYVFVAATMPAEGERSVGAEIAARFPEAAWLSGRQLHQSKRAVSHEWRRVEGPQQRAAALREVLAADTELRGGQGRMLVFARDVASAEATAAALQQGAQLPAAAAGDNSGSGSGGIPVLLYHKGVPAGERAAALARMSSQRGLVMVCTDAAARGLDVPEVTHVVQVRGGWPAALASPRPGRLQRSAQHGAFRLCQLGPRLRPHASRPAQHPTPPPQPPQADFAQSAVDFLHRVGRTGRAGRGGRVTSLYTPEAEPLVDAIRDAIAAGALGPWLPGRRRVGAIRQCGTPIGGQLLLAPEPCLLFDGAKAGWMTGTSQSVWSLLRPLLGLPWNPQNVPRLPSTALPPLLATLTHPPTHPRAAGQPVEGAFSRKRSFRKKLRKYGQYVPRGAEGPAEPRKERKAQLAQRAEQRRQQRW